MATTPLRLPDLAFEDADGKPKKLSDWRGKTVLVNLWATWCVPCRKEMPALDGLQAKLGGKDFEVVAINIDTRDPEKPKNFLKDANLTRLGYFTDQKAKVFQDLKSDRPGAGHADLGAGRWPRLRDRHHRRPRRMGQRRRGQADQGGGAAGNCWILGRTCRDCRRRRRRHWRRDVLAAQQGQYREFLRIGIGFHRCVVAICCCRPPACMARRLATMLIIPYAVLPVPAGTLPGRVNECWKDRPTKPDQPSDRHTRA